MAGQTKRSKNYRKEKHGGPKYAIDNRGTRSVKEKADKKEVVCEKKDLNVDVYEDWE
jgi:hypothetical protein